MWPCLWFIINWTFCGFATLENDHNTSSFQGDPHKPKDVHNAKPNGKSNHSSICKTKQLKKHSNVMVEPIVYTTHWAIEKEKEEAAPN